MEQKYQEYYNQIRNMVGDYGKENPEVMSAFSKLHHVASKDGDLKSKHKELIALGISINSKCEGCIVMHIHDALETGATRKEIVETIGTAIYMGGGPSVVHGAKAFAALKDFDETKTKQLILNN